MSRSAALDEALQRICGEVTTEPGVVAALVDEKRAALESGRLGPVRVRGEGGAVGVVVLRASGRRAALLGISPRAGESGAALIDAWIPELRDEGVRTVVVGGPPGCYLESGVASDDARALDFWAARGFRGTGRHVDLRVELRAAGELDARVRRAEESERGAVMAWMRSAWIEAWAQEVERAWERGAVWVAGERGAYVGFAAHSGNNAAMGTFGPLGVVEAERGSGLGGALAQAALDGLGRSGWKRAVIPWVNPRLIEFYRARVAGVTVVERVVMAWEDAR